MKAKAATGNGSQKLVDPAAADAARLGSRLRFRSGRDPSAGRVFLAAREEKLSLQAELMELQLDERRGDLVQKETSFMEAEESGRVIGRHIDNLSNYLEEIISAHESGGFAQARKFFNARLHELRAAISLALVAEAGTRSAGAAEAAGSLKSPGG